MGRYIHLNPVRARVVRKPENFRWSSYGNYVRGRNDGLVHTDETLGPFSKGRRVAIRRYREFLNEGLGGRSPLENAIGSFLGDEGFSERVVKYLRVLPDKTAIPELRKIGRKQGIDEIVRGVAPAIIVCRRLIF